MDLETITTILAVARMKSFGSAAYMIPCSQSSVSRKVMAAETELGVKLFVRPTESKDKTLSVTEAGEQIIPVLEKIVDNYRELFSVANDFAEKKSPLVHLRLGIMSGCMLPFVFSCMKADLYDQNPNISLEMEFGQFDHLLAKLKSRQLDAMLFPCLSINQEALPCSDQFALRELGSACFSIGISSADPLLQKKTVTPGMLRDKAFFLSTDFSPQVPGITFFSSETMRKVLQRDCGFDPKIHPLPGHMREICYQFAVNGRGVFTSHLPRPWRAVTGVEYLDYPALDSLRQSYFLLLHKRSNPKVLDYFCSFFSKALRG